MKRPAQSPLPDIEGTSVVLHTKKRYDLAAVVPKVQDEYDIPKISISHGYTTNCNDVIYWIRNRASSSPTKINNRPNPCTIIFKVLKFTVAAFDSNFNKYACNLWCSASYDYHYGKKNRTWCGFRGLRTFAASASESRLAGALEL